MLCILEITFFFTGVSPDKYRLTRISTENKFRETGHRTVDVGRHLLRCSNPASSSRQDALLYKNKKVSLPIREKKTVTNIGSVNIYKTTSLSVDEMPTVLQNEIYCLERLNYFVCLRFGL